MRTSVCLALLLAMAQLGCSEEDHFFPPRAFAMTSDMPPVAVSRRISYWQVQMGVELPVRAPTSKELTRIYETTPEPWLARAPWIEAGDFGIEVEYTLTNQNGVQEPGGYYDQGFEDLAVEVLLDAWTEFNEYVPDFVESAVEVTPNISGVDDFVLVPPGGRISGTIRMDQVEEVEYDFATILSNPDEVNANCVVYFPNDHEHPERCANAVVPGMVPGLVGFTVGIRTTVASDLAIEFVVRVRDRSGKLWIEGEDKLSERLELPERVPFTPAPPEEP